MGQQKKAVINKINGRGTLATCVPHVANVILMRASSYYRRCRYDF